jgi:hypothetical protein
MEKVSLKDFYEMLEKHDWYHLMSDDGRVDRMGAANYERIKIIATQSPEHQALFDQYEKHMWTGKPWNTEQAPLPEEPKD